MKQYENGSWVDTEKDEMIGSWDIDMPRNDKGYAVWYMYKHSNSNYYMLMVVGSCEDEESRTKTIIPLSIKAAKNAVLDKFGTEAYKEIF